MGEATPYSILYAWPWGQHQNVILSPDSQVGLPNGRPEIPKIGTFATLDAHNFVCKPPIEMKSKSKLSPLLRSL